MLFLNKIPKPETFQDFGEPNAFKIWMKWAMAAAVAVCAGGLLICACIEGCRKESPPPDGQKAPETETPSTEPPPDLHSPVRDAPASFPPDSNLPRGKEIYASGPIDLETFDPKRDLVRFEDPRVWFESDHDGPGDDEDDHLIHRAMEVPLRRLVNLLDKKRRHAQSAGRLPSCRQEPYSHGALAALRGARG